MRIGLMQPYFFPYIGYFQLIKAVDKFIVYDDVTFIKQGWINRNRILANGAALLFSVPLSGSGSHVLIRNVKINSDLYAAWRIKFFKTLEQYYKKAPYYEEVQARIHGALDCDPTHISELAVQSIKSVCSYCEIDTEIITSAVHYNNSYLRAEERVIDICRQEGASAYLNAAGGQDLYSRENFKACGIDLNFIKAKELPYKQFKAPFVPWLSIIDVMMFNPPAAIQEQLCAYELG